MSDFNSRSEDHPGSIAEGGQGQGQPVDADEHGAQSLDRDHSRNVLTETHRNREVVDAGTGDASSGSSEALGEGISALLEGVIRDFDSVAVDTAGSQDQLSAALDRLTRELDQLLEDAPVPFVMQHTARISGVRKRVKSLNIVLRTIQLRLDNVDRMLTAGLPHGEAEKLRKGSKSP